MNGFAETHFVGQQQARREPAHNRERRLELKGKQVDGRTRRRAQLAELAAPGGKPAQEMQPSPPAHGADRT